LFTIKDEARNFERNRVIEIGFFVKSLALFKLPQITSIKFNGAQICPEFVASSNGGESGCVKFDMDGDGIGGRWDGKLTIIPKASRSGIRVDIELTSPAWALGVSESCELCNVGNI
jgi:hypothetical protein